MKLVEPTTYPGWNQHPVYRCPSYEAWDQVSRWMRKNHVECFLLLSGSYGYTFQVRSNQDWFALRWL